MFTCFGGCVLAIFFSCFSFHVYTRNEFPRIFIAMPEQESIVLIFTYRLFL